jgi:hypothetical protein
MRTHRFETSVLVVAWLAGIGCEASARRSLAPAGPTATDGIVVESAVLETIGTATCEGCSPFVLDRDFRECHVKGVVRNDGAASQSVTLTFDAYDPAGVPMGSAVAPHNLVPAGGRTAYEAAFPFANCDRVHRFEIADIDVEPA